MNDQALSAVIARNVRAIRTRKGLRQSDVSERVGGTLTRLALSTSEQGTRALKIDELPGICRVLGVSLADLLAGSNDLPALLPSDARVPAPTLASALWPELEPMVRTTVRATLMESFRA